MFEYNDGGRSEAGYKTQTDCGIRAVAIATGLSYKESRKLLQKHCRKGRLGSGAITRGIPKEDISSALGELGWVWKSAPKFEGRKARYSDMPMGNVVARMAGHVVAVIDGVVNDTWDSRDKMVYGYWVKEG